MPEGRGEKKRREGLLGLKREKEEETGAGGVGSIETDGAAELLGQDAADVESHSVSADGAGLETLEDMVGEVLRHSIAGIGDGDGDHSRILRYGTMDVDLALGGVLAGIGQEIDQNLLDAARVGVDPEAVVDLGGAVHLHTG